MIQKKCTWCETIISDPTLTNCPNCGGTLAVVSSGEDPGPRPPNAPRELPKKFIKKIKYTQNVWMILGIVYVAAFCAMSITGVVLILFMKSGVAPTILFSVGLFFGIGGMVMMKVGMRKAKKELIPLMNGNSTHGTITEVVLNTRVKINNRHPSVIRFSFDANGQKMTGDVGNLFDEASRMKKPGDKIWVVYLLDDPNQSSAWPPLT